MNKRNKKIVFLTCLAVAAVLGFSTLIYLSLRLGGLREEKKGLLKDFRLMEEEMAVISSTLDEKDKQLENLNDKIDQLSYPQRLKQALSAAQSMVNTLNSELINVKTQADILRGENFALKSRVSANTKELDRLVQELNQAKTKIATLQGSEKMALQEERLTWLSNQIKDKDRQIRGLNRDIGQLNNKYSDIIKERDFLKKNIERYQKDLAGKKPSQIWQKRLEELAKLLQEKENEKNEILRRFVELSEDKDEFLVEIDSQRRNIEELKNINQLLQGQALKLTADLSRKNNELSALERSMREIPVSNDAEEVKQLQAKYQIQKERLKAVNSLYARLKEQLKDLSGILYNKDTALDYKEKQISDLKDELSFLKIKTDNLEQSFSSSEANQRRILERLNQTQDLNITLQERLGEVSDLLGGEDEDFDPGYGYPGDDPLEEPDDGLATKESTENLRKRVEVILESIESSDSLD